MNMQLSTSSLRPETIATMIADLLGAPNKEIRMIQQLVWELENKTSDEASIDYLAEAGVAPETLDGVFGLLHD